MNFPLLTIMAAAFAFSFGAIVATWVIQQVNGALVIFVTALANREAMSRRLAKFTCPQCMAGVSTYYCYRCGYHSPGEQVDTTLEGRPPS